MLKDTPLVSICCITYNHAPFIRKCLDGFLMQKTTFPIEILIHDDCSTDGTVEILKEYEINYPNLIFPLYETENKYQNGGAGKMDLYNYNRAKGKYIAYCEGDDYWTDSLKLQKQVDFMESHPDFSVCFTRWSSCYTKENSFDSDGCGALFQNGQMGIEITRSLFFNKWVTQPLTMLFRFECYESDWREKYKLYRDMYDIYNLLLVGKGYLMSDVTGQYNIHSGGIFSMANTKKACDIGLIIAEDLYAVHKDDETKENLQRVLQWNIDNSKENLGKRIKLIYKLFTISKDFKHLIKNLISISKEKHL